MSTEDIVDNTRTLVRDSTASAADGWHYATMDRCIPSWIAPVEPEK